MKYAIIELGRVVNVAIADSPMGDNWIEDEAAGIGWTYSNGVFTAPVAPTPVPVRKGTHLWFRGKFTAAEQEWADELEATFESNAMLTAAQKRTLRTGYKNFNLATEVNLDDPRIPPMLGLYVALGGLESHRPAEILA